LHVVIKLKRAQAEDFDGSGPQCCHELSVSANLRSGERMDGNTARSSGWVWAAFLLLCLIAAGAAITRTVVLLLAPASGRGSATAELDAAFASRRALTLWHIIPALLLVALLPFWFLRRVRERPEIHRRVMYALMILGVIVGVTALMLSMHPVGGINEAAATIGYDVLFLFSLGRAWLMYRRGEFALHRAWMIRGIAVLLGIALTRPVMGVFFATQRITHLQPQQFFGTAMWIGFSAMYITGEAYLRSHPIVGAAAPLVAHELSR
jgi:Predicted membrane protein (DUF2306)